MHIHVEKAEGYARIEIETCKVTDMYRMGSKELKRVIKLVEEHRELFEEAWNEYCKS